MLAQGKDVVPIPGTKRRKYLDQNLDALDVKLTPEELKQIDGLFAKGAAVGARYPDEYMNRLGV